MSSRVSKTHDYKVINPTIYRNIEEAANTWAEQGWRVVAVVSDTRPGYAHSLLLERPVARDTTPRPLTPDPGKQQT